MEIILLKQDKKDKQKNLRCEGYLAPMGARGYDGGPVNKEKTTRETKSQVKGYIYSYGR